MTTRTTITCEKCGKEAEMPDVHTLPDGWERCGHGDDFCDTCVAEYTAALRAYVLRQQAQGG